MNQILVKMSFFRVYLDDVVQFFDTIQEHYEHLKNLLACFFTAKLKLNVYKRFFSKEQVNIFCHVVDDSGVRVDEGKLPAIQEIPRPRTVTELRRFLGQLLIIGTSSGGFLRYKSLFIPVRIVGRNICGQKRWIRN